MALISFFKETPPRGKGKRPFFRKLSSYVQILKYSGKIITRFQPRFNRFNEKFKSDGEKAPSGVCSLSWNYQNYACNVGRSVVIYQSI
jgi:hypothetical protein